MSDLQSASDCGDDWEAAGDLVRFNTRFAPGTPDWEQAQTAVLAGILDGREQAAWEAALESAEIRANRAEANLVLAYQGS